MSILRIAAVLLLSGCAGATAHERWADGTGIPVWVKQSCCGVADAHRLTISQIKHIDEEGGWLLEGHDYIVPDSRVLPSHDGFVWIFYVTYYDGRQSTTLLFHTPGAHLRPAGTLTGPMTRAALDHGSLKENGATRLHARASHRCDISRPLLKTGVENGTC